MPGKDIPDERLLGARDAATATAGFGSLRSWNGSVDTALDIASKAGHVHLCMVR